jgi:hypothetical protein
VKLGVRLGGSADPSQQVLKVKIDSTPRKREATLESAVWRATSQKHEKWRTLVISCQRSKTTRVTLSTLMWPTRPPAMFLDQ